MKSKDCIINFIWNRGRITLNNKLFNLIGGEKVSILFIKDGRKYYISPNGGDDGFKFNNNKVVHRFASIIFVKDILNSRNVIDKSVSYVVSEKPIIKEGYTCYEITNKTAY